MTQIEKDTLDARLPKGWLAIAVERCAANKLTIQPAMISRVKNGVRENQDILDVLLNIAEEEDQRKEALSARILGGATA